MIYTNTMFLLFFAWTEMLVRLLKVCFDQVPPKQIRDFDSNILLSTRYNGYAAITHFS